VLLGLPRSAGADPRELEFIHGLQDRGWADVALDYLDRLQLRGAVPPAVRDALDLERCNCYLAWARTTPDRALAGQREAQAQAYLDKFRKEHPKDPRTATAATFWGGLVLDRGQQQWRAARRFRDPGGRAAAMAEARTTLEAAGRRLAEANQACQQWLAQSPPAPAGKAAAGASSVPGEREQAELAEIDSRFRLALVYYYVAQTYPADEPQHGELLTKASNRFDAIYQELRHAPSRACLLAHLWNGRCVEELGDADTAADIYEETLANEPAGDNVDPELASIYAEATYLQLRQLAAKGDLREFLDKAQKWLDAHPGWRGLPAAQGLALETAKARLTLAEGVSGRARRKLVEEAVATLSAVAKVTSEYREEAIEWHRRAVAGLGKGALAADEDFALGDAALAAKQWSEAQANYTKALNLAQKKKDETAVRQARLRLSRVAYARAAELYAARKYEESLAAAGELAQQDASDPSVARSALLALFSAAGLFDEAADKDAALARLEKVARFVTGKWAGRPEADDARITLGQAQLVKGNREGAMGWFRQVDAKSPRYPTVLLIEGRMHWRDYQAERKKDPQARSAAAMTAALDAAREQLQGALDRLKKGVRAEATDSASQAAEAQLLLAEVLMEGRQYQQAVTLLEPLVARVRALRPQSIDLATFGTVMAAIRARLALGQTEQAAKTASVLLEISADQPAMNQSLVNFLRLLAREQQQAEAVIARPGAAAKAVEEAQTKAAALRQLLGKLLAPLLKRHEFSLADMAHLGDLCAAVGMNDEALAQYRRLLDKAPQDPDADKATKSLIVRARAQIVGLLRAADKYEDALGQIDQLIAENPGFLAPLVTRAEILENWGRRDPAKYEPAVAQWAEVRVRLGRQAVRPPAYYQAVYGTAFCLFGQWKATKDASFLTQAEQVLKSTLVLNSKLNGPDMVAKYKDLLKQIEKAR
jgi:tetratricopeptide (TPR) repeat protein